MAATTELNQRLLRAAQEGHASLTARLLAQGADPRCRNENNQTPLMLAALNGRFDCLQALLPLAPPNGEIDHMERDALMLAALGRNPDCVLALLPHSNPLRRAVDGFTALMHTLPGAPGRSAPCLALLLPVSDPKAVEQAGRSALMLAASFGAADCVSLLLPVSDPDAQGSHTYTGMEDQSTALMMAAERGSMDCVKLLFPASNPDIRDSAGRDALMRACSNGQAECARWLLSQDPTLAKSTDAEGDTALMIACGSVLRDPSLAADCAREALPHSDPNANNITGQTAWQLAADAGNIACSRLLAPATHPHLILGITHTLASGIARSKERFEIAEELRAIEESVALRLAIDRAPQAPKAAPRPRPRI